MKLKNLLISVAAACFGAVVAAVLVYYFYTAFIDETLTARYSAELSQDIAMYKSIRQDDHEKISRLIRIRMAGDLVGLLGQCDRLSASEKSRVRDLFQKVNELGIDGPIIPEPATLGPPFAGCP